MKQFGAVIGICVAFVAVVLIGVVTYHSMFSRNQAAAPKTNQIPLLGGKGFREDGASLSKTAGSSGVQSNLSTTTQMLKELSQTLEESDTADLSSIEEQLSQL